MLGIDVYIDPHVDLRIDDFTKIRLIDFMITRGYCEGLKKLTIGDGSPEIYFRWEDPNVLVAYSYLSVNTGSVEYSHYPKYTW